VPPDHVYTVSRLQSEVRDLLESGYRNVWLEAEISGHRRYPSGHHYLTLKDENAQLSAVIWRSVAARLAVAPEDGLAVRVRGTLTVYPPRGNYQILVDRLEPLGEGPLQARFEQMRRRLEEEGLFDPARKRPVPAFPRRMGVITSPAGAAVRDVIRVSGRRWPLLEIVVIPVRVQGATAKDEIAAAIRHADRKRFDLLLVTRGGGSLEDLWAFNEEVVARAVFEASTPVVSAVGHEVDVTICDLVADVRAATPSAAAELVTPDRDEVHHALDLRRARMGKALAGAARELRLRLDRIAAARCFRRPDAIVRDGERRVDEIAARLGRAAKAAVKDFRSRLGTIGGRMEALSPLRVLARGYSVTFRDGRVVRRSSDLKPGDRIRTRLAEGEIESTVEP